MNKKGIPSVWTLTALLLVVSMVLPWAAFADVFVWDGDVVTTGNQTTVNLGTVAPGAVIVKQISFQLQCAGKQHVDNGQTVGISFNLGGSTVPVGGALTATGASIGAIPSSWPIDTTGGGTTNCPSPVPILDDNGNSSATITAPTSPGSYQFVVVYSSNLSPPGSGDPQAITGPNPSVTYNLVVQAPSDTTAPTTSIALSPASPDGLNGWYVSNVHVTVSAVDNPGGSGVAETRCVLDPATAPASFDAIPAGCAYTGTGADVTTEGQHTIYAASKDIAGNKETPVSQSFKIDKTAPTISGSAAPSPNAAGWNNSPVTISFTCADSMSGVASCGPDQTLTGDGAGQSATGTAVDNAGNSKSAVVSNINIDKTPPTIAFVGPSTSPWYNADVMANWSCSDAVSGVESASVSATTSGEGTAVAATGTCTDNAGNTASDTQYFMVDKTAPALTGCDSPDGLWHANNVTLYCTYTDGGSGPASQQVGLSTSVAAGHETANAVASAVGANACDVAGNCATSPADIAGNKIDRKAPTNIAFVGGPAADGIYYFGFVPAAPTCTATDGGSGLKSCQVTGWSDAIGDHTMTATATDNVGNLSTATRSYSVMAWTLNGFYQPVDMGGVWNTVKGGSTVPLKFEIFAGTTELTYVAAVKSFSAKPVACPTTGAVADEIEFVSTGGTVLRYDWTAGQFIQNWQTPKKPGSCYSVTMTTQDASFLTAYFKLK